MARIIWTRSGAEDLLSIRSYIAQFSPLAAQRLAIRLLAAADSLADLPHRGRPISLGRRELPSIAPYLIRYQYSDGEVRIVEIRHSAREPDGST